MNVSGSAVCTAVDGVEDGVGDSEGVGDCDGAGEGDGDGEPVACGGGQDNRQQACGHSDTSAHSASASTKPAKYVERYLAPRLSR